MYIYIYTHVCTYICIYIHMCIALSLSIYIYILAAYTCNYMPSTQRTSRAVCTDAIAL